MERQTDRIRKVDPGRLSSGRWCHSRDRMVGEGDISASYSADRIGMSQPLRKPFRFEGAIWTSVGSSRDGVRAYRLVHRAAFDGQAFSYNERCGEQGRQDPNGFYHGMFVRHGGNAMVLCGPPLTFVEGEREQLSLF